MRTKTPEVSVHRAVREINGEYGRWDGQTTRLLPLDQYPAFLTIPAIGQFPTVEEALRGKDVLLPQEWQTQHMLAVIALSAAVTFSTHLPFKQEGNFTLDTPIVLITDSWHEKQVGDQTISPGIGFRINFQPRHFAGSIFTQEYGLDDPAKRHYRGTPYVHVLNGRNLEVDYSLVSQGLRCELMAGDFIQENGLMTPLFRQLVDNFAGLCQNPQTNHLNNNH